MLIQPDVDTYLENIIKANNITLIQITGDQYGPDVVSVKKKVIIMNLNYRTSFSYHFRMAHELAHLLSDAPKLTYNHSQLSKGSAEHQANLYGIKLLADYYFSEEQSKKDHWDRRFQFIETFGLSRLTHLVEKTLKTT
ncbi:ImmA/IrrE family metallo-endopeptidase [Leuconostoc rapi]|uniref:ImmA/IrrE family metallo-endopeptidase n=1 Tax=Leuconostoc rapi TaxID=1406906 RepID=UPI00195A916F|nr:ImmA/IrrE family metallo-endopeptidase [Leuconostoc rapi]MBM7435305.1 Zn-dependent peptidase ImmA (M78 family) [Leuconostoc rapi]